MLMLCSNPINSVLKGQFFVFVRHYGNGKVRQKWQYLKTRRTGHHLALRHFDTRYGPYFGDLWPSIRLALLSQQKYCAVLNTFAFTEEDLLRLNGSTDVIRATEKWRESRDVDGADDGGGTVRVDDPHSVSVSESEQLDMGLADDWQSEAEFVPPPTDKLRGPHGTVIEVGREDDLSYLDSPAVQVQRVEEEVEVSPHLKVYTFPTGDISLFPPARRNHLGYMGYYLMDASSILPVLALCLQPSDCLLDMCAAPGGKTLVAANTNTYQYIMSNEPNASRRLRLHQALDSYLPGGGGELGAGVVVSGRNGRHWTVREEDPGFSKVLVDVPCTTDRHNLFEDESNIFSLNRVEERMRIPHRQRELLKSALQLVEVGGSVVYSTCSLSPLQNDAIIHSTVQELEESSRIRVIVHSLHSLAHRFSSIFNFHRHTRFGLLVIPSVTRNFGPMYVSKLQRLK